MGNRYRAYTIGEDCLILQAAVMVGVHRKYGKNGGISTRAPEFARVHDTLCQSRGLARGRSMTSLKMRLYRLLNAGIMNWGPPKEKARVCYKHKRALDNLGTAEQDSLREQLLARIFRNKDGTYCKATPTIRKKYTRQRQKPLPAPTAIGNPHQGEDGRVLSTKRRELAVQQPIATPQLPNPRFPRTIGRDFVGNQPFATPICPSVLMHRDLQAQRQRGFAPPSDTHELSQTCERLSEQVGGGRRADAVRHKVSTLQIAYKENLKTFRELASMQHETLEFLRDEWEKHRDFLKRSLDDVSQQQQQLLQLMKDVARTV